MHPLIEEIKRASEQTFARRGIDHLKPSAVIDWGRRLVAEIQPQLDRVDGLERENAELREQLGQKKAKRQPVEAA